MKKLDLIGIMLCIHPLTAGLAAQENPETPAHGFSARIQAGAYAVRTDGQLYVGDDNAQNTDLNGPSEAYDEIEALASVFLSYQFKNGTTLYAGNPLEIDRDLALSAGIIQPLGKSILDASLVWAPIDEVWSNPYQVGTARKQTDINAIGARIKVQQIFGSPWELYYDMDSTDVDNDEIGALQPDLKRNGSEHELGIKYTLPLREGLSLRPEIGYRYGNFEGDSNSYQGLQIGALLNGQYKAWNISAQVFGIQNQYEHSHPLFGKTRDEIGFVVMTQATRTNLFGKEALFANLMAGYSSVDANIDFFDTQTALCLLSIGINL